VTGAEKMISTKPQRLGVPGVRVLGLLFGVAAVANGWGAAVHSGSRPLWTVALAALGAALGTTGFIWFAILACRVKLTESTLTVYGVYRVRRFPIEEVAGLDEAAGRWPGRGAPYVWLRSHPADYLQVRLRDGTTYRPPALCTLASRADRVDAVPTVVRRLDTLLANG
jgi:hypothetical protein